MSYSVISDGRGVLAEDELLSSSGEVLESGDRKVFVVELGVFSQHSVGL